MAGLLEKLRRRSEVSEKSIEAYLVRQLRNAGIACVKYSSQFLTGYPDRLVLLPFGQVVWVELKSEGEEPTKLQKLRHDELDRIGHSVYVVSSKQEADALVIALKASMLVKRMKRR